MQEMIIYIQSSSSWVRQEETRNPNAKNPPADVTHGGRQQQAGGGRGAGDANDAIADVGGEVMHGGR